MKIPYWAKIVIGILTCNLVGIIASGVTLDAIPGWYAQLNKPFFNPPNWVFGPVWTLLYTLMGVGAAGIWQVGLDQSRVKRSLSIFGIQLILNGIWSFLFFGLKKPLLAFLEILLLLVAIVMTMYQFKKIKPWAAWLLLPYLLWVAFASILNYAIILLN
ncbi:TspO/MBR family protein [Fodinibius sediminis]|uniref:TspO and MBR related proteins n=1 Tax=Fodinibius sediminis TaxID=1214077 RepID=A0A521BDS6_9BACT|nr:TspO/MBR family protein [Fodinibius sediminis]SMO45268.1 TspO and MBR related proteins [Fodinibius sediminis]